MLWRPMYLSPGRLFMHRTYQGRPSVSLSSFVTSFNLDLSFPLLPLLFWISPIFCYLVAIWISPLLCYLKGCGSLFTIVTSLPTGSLPYFVTSGYVDLSSPLLPLGRWISHLTCHLFRCGSLPLSVTSSPVDLSTLVLPLSNWISHPTCYLINCGSLHFRVTSKVLDLSPTLLPQ